MMSEDDLLEYHNIGKKVKRIINTLMLMVQETMTMEQGPMTWLDTGYHPSRLFYHGPRTRHS